MQLLTCLLQVAFMHSPASYIRIQGSVSFPPKTRPWCVGWTNIYQHASCSSYPTINTFEQALSSVTFQGPSFFYHISCLLLNTGFLSKWHLDRWTVFIFFLQIKVYLRLRSVSLLRYQSFKQKTSVDHPGALHADAASPLSLKCVSHWRMHENKIKPWKRGPFIWILSPL